LTLVASNGGVPQTKPDAFPRVVSRTIFNEVPAGVSGLDWQVDLPPGTYRLEAFVPSMNLRNQSRPFEVEAGPDLSCIPEFAVLSTGSSARPTLQPITTSVAVPQASAADEEDKGEEDPSLEGLGSGTIAGVAVGAVVVLLLIPALAFFCIRRRRALKAGGGIRGRMLAVPYFAATPAANEPPPPPYDPSPIDPFNAVPYRGGPATSSSGRSLSMLKTREARSSLAHTSPTDSRRTKPTSSFSTGEPPIPLQSRHPPSSTFISSSPTDSVELTAEERNDLLRGFASIRPLDPHIPMGREKR
jgi:hypothetical protein